MAIEDSTIDEYQNLLADGVPKGSEDAQTWSEIDPLGDSIFGWGDASRNRAIARQQDQLRKLKGKISTEQLRMLQSMVGANDADWAKASQSILGADGKRLEDFYGGVEASDQAALGDLKGALGNYSSLSDLYNDPSMYGDVGDVKNAALPTEQTVSNQRDALSKFKALSNPEETAQERLIRLMAQREQEANQQGDREAMASSLKARGVYGSGAEVVSSLMSQAARGQARSEANARANAQASQRAMQALGSWADMSGKMRASETGEGSLANQVAMFNNQINQGTSNARSAGLQASTAGDNDALAKRATTGFEATRGVNDRTRGDEAAKTGTMLNLTQGTTGNRTAGAGAMNSGYENLLGGLDKKLAEDESSKETPWIGGGIG